MATNPFADFISGEALGSQPRLAYQAMLGDPNRGDKAVGDRGSSPARDDVRESLRD